VNTDLRSFQAGYCYTRVKFSLLMGLEPRRPDTAAAHMSQRVSRLQLFWPISFCHLW